VLTAAVLSFDFQPDSLPELGKLVYTEPLKNHARGKEFVKPPGAAIFPRSGPVAAFLNDVLLRKPLACISPRLRRAPRMSSQVFKARQSALSVDSGAAKKKPLVDM
jgi:hypothetical protein